MELTVSNNNLGKYRDEFQRACDGWDNWRKQAKQCYEFKQGKQWDEDVKKKLEGEGRPVLTINQVRPFLNLLGGFYSLNKTEPDFLPRTLGDDEVCDVGKAVTKWIYDQTNYNKHKNDVFDDKCTGGKGVYYVGYRVKPNQLDGEIFIERRSPFSIYIDPECLNPDLSDCNYIDIASWVHKEELKRVYPEFADDIDIMVTEFDDAEKKGVENTNYYDKNSKKLRVIEHWHKEHYMQTVYSVNGKLVREESAGETLATIDPMTMPEIKKAKLPAYKMKVAVFCGGIVLEENDSQYKHNKFPIVLDYAYWTGENDTEEYNEPHGVVYDMLDLQREKNKTRSQIMHLINTTSNKGWQHWGLSDKDKKKLKTYGATPGVDIEVPPDGRLEPLQNPGFPNEIVAMDQQNSQDMKNVTGINEQMLGTDNGLGMSGKAYELRQRQSVTQIAVLFDGSKEAEKRILDLLWGCEYEPGLIPQYLTEETVIRVISDGKPNFVQIAPTGQAMQPMTDEMGQQIVDPNTGKVAKVYDLSKFRFDIVISDSPISPTQRAADFLKLIEAQKSGIPIPPDMILEYLDIPNKNELKERMSQAQPQGPQISASVSIDMAALQPQYQEMLLQAVVQSGQIKANFKEQPNPVGNMPPVPTQTNAIMNGAPTL
jgi:hypothetical protein